MSFAQEGIWLFERAFPGTRVQQVAACLTLEGPWTADQVRHATHQVLNHALARHVKAPAALAAGRMAAAPAAVEVLPAPADAPVAAGLVPSLAERALDFANGQVAHAWIVPDSPLTHRVVLSVHRVVADWAGLQVVAEQIAKTLQASAVPEPESGADFGSWQRQWSETEDFRAQRAWWKAAAQPPLPVLQLPAVGRRSVQRSFAAACVQLNMPAALATRLSALAGSLGALKLQALLLAAYGAVLARHASQDDLVVGWHVGLQGLAPGASGLQPLENWLPLRLSVDAAGGFAALQAQVEALAQEAWQRRGVPFDLLLRDMGAPARSALPPLIQALFEYRESSSAAVEELVLPASAFELHLVATRRAGAMQLSLRFNTELFNHQRAQRFVEHFCVLLGAALGAPETPLCQLPLLGAAERQQIVAGFNRTSAAFPDDQCLHSLVSAQARRTPDATAYIFEGRHCSYAEVERWSDAIAAQLAAQGIGKGCFVPLLMDRSVELPVAMLGVMKAGAAFVPMDVHWPAQRAQLIIRDTGSAVVLVTQATPLAAHVPEGARAVEIQVDKLATAIHWQAPAIGSQDPIYMIYTSGSTGLPKGAINKHVGIVNRLSYMTRRYGCSLQDVILQTSAHIFDASVWQYFWPLINGAVSVLPSPMAGFDHRHVTELVGRYKVTVTDFVPSVFNIMVDILEQDEDLRQRLASLRQILIGGEALSPKAVFRFLQRYPQASITNTYGPTETSIGVIFYEVGREYEDPLPIGRPIANVNAYILDESMQPVPVGVPGMLHVGGVCVGLGYHHDAQKTAAVFLPNPFPEVHPGPIYKTGDLARYRESGDIEFLGRADHQVKIRGVRIELGEIEAKLNQHPGVQSAVVNVWETADGAKRLAAYLVPLQGEGPSTEALRAFLKETLPEYVIPGAFVRMPQMPLLRSGKVDRKALPPPAVEADRTRPTGQPPRTATQKLIAKAWQDEIGRDDVCIHDNFFELGGDSLAALKVLARLEMEFGIRLEAEQMMNQTLGQLAASLPGAQDDETEEALAEPSLPALQAFYFGPAEHALFGTLQVPAGSDHTRGGVVVCAPLGHEYLFTHRCLRHLGQLLAGQGQAVMRFDYLGTGDSLGEAEDVSLAGCEQGARSAMLEATQRLPGTALSVIGLRLGAPVAAQAAAAMPGVDRVVLWDPVTTGATYLGELRSVHERLFGGPPAAVDAGDTVEMAGFPLSRRFHDEIQALGREPFAALAGKQVLVIDSTDEALQAPFCAWLIEQGVAATHVQIVYPEIWNQDPYKTRLPTRILDEICHWLGQDRA